MAVTTAHGRKHRNGDTPSGVPGPHELGASRKEALWALLAIFVLLLIALSFWFQASR